jgi:hypothetical protein
MMSSLLSLTTTRFSNGKHIILSNVASRSYRRGFLFPTTYTVVSLLIRWTLSPAACTLLMVWTDYRGRSAWMHKSRRCLNYRQGIPIRRSPYRAHWTVREDNIWTLAIQRQQKPAEPSSFDGYSHWKGQGCSYINELENYNAGEIAKIATDYGLYEEVLTIYKKYNQHAMAINVPVEHIVSMNVDSIMPTNSTGPKFGADSLKPSWMACGLRTLLVRNISLFLLILNSLG